MERGTFGETSELTTCVTRDRSASNRDFFVGEREKTTTGTERELSSTIHSETAERSCFCDHFDHLYHTVFCFPFV